VCLPALLVQIHHEINQFCSSNTLQDVFIDKFDTVRGFDSLFSDFDRSCCY
jgi:hypothetical protein